MNKKFLTAVTASTLVALAAFTPAINAEDYDQQIDSANSQIENIANKKASVSSEIDALTQKINTTKERVMATLQQQQNTLESVNQLQSEISKLETIISERQERLEDQARAVQVNGARTYVDFLVNADSFTDVINRVEVVMDLVNANRDLMNQQAADKAAVESKEQEQQAKLLEQQKMAYELETLKEELDNTMAQYSATLATLSEEEQQAIANRDGLVAEKEAYEARIAEEKRLAEEARIAEEKRLAEEAAAQKAAEEEAQANQAAEEARQQAQQPVAKETTSNQETIVSTNTNNTPSVDLNNTADKASSANTSVSEEARQQAEASKNLAPSNAGGAIAIAQQYIGVPYVWGGTTPSGFDCSGLVQYVYAQMGINLPRVTYNQENAGTRISLSEAQPGDLLFWGAAGASYHVAIYAGNETFIHAPTFGQTVQFSTFQYNRPSFAVRL
ncbi:Cell wall-associated hydrolase, NlpC family [Granulicatella balaenopterae]|uniref:Cell wall-associated hydrolase, NlpC family n=1 Tax=Granulicatella balaenopterae TaxID=137733 RepID=A0A1H9JI23_9LACT|nr:C40 family peptidase [Granulicatella balaenopterae]SEQ86398.1 Cell wall-associated hydrolase, NlpC family [Granulicatella balaenopterae]